MQKNNNKSPNVAALPSGLLRRTQAEPGSGGKLQQEQTSPNLEHRIKEISVEIELLYTKQMCRQLLTLQNRIDALFAHKL